MNKLAVIGYPAKHSLSPKMHNFISGELGLDYLYSAVDVPPEELGEVIDRFRKEGIAGFNVTAPHKVAVMEYLDEISPEAEAFGAVNTVVNKNGRLVGYNTDAEGFYEALLYLGIDVQDADVLILGAGGAGVPVSMYLASKNPKSLTILNRTREKAEALKCKIRDYCGYSAEIEQKHDGYHVIINATTLGMGKNAELSPLSDYGLAKGWVIDMIYSPLETKLLENAREMGAKTQNGILMLVFQGILSYELFTGAKVDRELAHRIINEVLR